VKGVHSAIRSHEYWTEKKDKHNQVWLARRATPEDQRGGRERYKIERKFGAGKQGHGLGRCRYLGLARCAIQALLTALSLNQKRMVNVLAGEIGTKRTKGPEGGQPAEETSGEAGTGPARGWHLPTRMARTQVDVSLIPKTGLLPHPLEPRFVSLW